MRVEVVVIPGEVDHLPVPRLTDLHVVTIARDEPHEWSRIVVRWKHHLLASHGLDQLVGLADIHEEHHIAGLWIGQSVTEEGV